MPKTKYTTEISGPNGYVFRIKATVYGRGSHVRAMLYSGKKGRTFALNGTLNFKDPEFSDFCSLLGVDEEHQWEADVREEPKNLPENEQPV